MSGLGNATWSLSLQQRKRKLADVHAAAVAAGDALSPSAGGGSGSGSDSGSRLSTSLSKERAAEAAASTKATRAKRQRLVPEEDVEAEEAARLATTLAALPSLSPAIDVVARARLRAQLTAAGTVDGEPRAQGDALPLAASVSESAAPLAASPPAAADSDALARLREENRILKKGVQMLAGMRTRLTEALHVAGAAASEAQERIRFLAEENEALQTALTAARAGAVMQSLLRLGLDNAGAGDADSGGDDDSRNGGRRGGGGHGGPGLGGGYDRSVY